MSALRTLLLAALLTWPAVAVGVAWGDENGSTATAPVFDSGQRQSALDEAAALAASRAAVGREIGAYTLRDQHGKSLSLADFRGQPLIVNMVYTSCYHTCPMISQTLARAVEVAAEALGAERFSVLTIGFDTPVDTPPAMAAYARRQDIDASYWKFLSGDGATIKALAADLGFSFTASPKGFDHLAQTTLLDGDGRIYRQILGESFALPIIVEPLKDLVFGRRKPIADFDDLIDKVRLFCTIYDPSRDAYRFDISLFISMSVGFVSIVGMIIYLIRGLRRGRPSALS